MPSWRYLLIVFEDDESEGKTKNRASEKTTNKIATNFVWEQLTKFTSSLFKMRESILLEEGRKSKDGPKSGNATVDFLYTPWR